LPATRTIRPTAIPSTLWARVSLGHRDRRQLRIRHRFWRRQPRTDREERARPRQVNVVPIPYTTDTTSGFGLALQGNSLYFTAGINFGDIDIGTWEAASQGCAANVNCAPAPTSAVEYTGLESAVDPTYTEASTRLPPPPTDRSASRTTTRQSSASYRPS